MDADIKIMTGMVQMDWFSCQVCDSVTLSFLTHGLCHLCQGFGSGTGTEMHNIFTYPHSAQKFRHHSVTI